MSDLPPWCAPTDAYVPRPGLLEAAVDASAVGPVMLIGAAGVGTTTFGATVAQALVHGGTARHALAIAVDALTERSDLALTLGVALDATLPGDEASLIDALHRGPVIAVLIDDTDLAPDAVRHIVGLSDRVRWILTGRRPVIGHPISVPPLDASAMDALVSASGRPELYQGRPLLAALAPELDPDADWSAALTDTWPALRLLADVPMGTGTHRTELPAVAVRTIDGRVRPRRSFREALGLTERPALSSLERVILQRAGVLHLIACDLSAQTSPEDLRLLRTASRTLRNPPIAALAACAAARMHIRCFQASEALDLVRERLRRDHPGQSARGMLRWLEGDALLTQGSYDLAIQAHQSAELDLREPAQIEARIALARRCADEWAARADPERAQAWLSIAREGLSRHDDVKGLADILRIRANLAAQAKELVGASALYDEALATLIGHSDASQERAFIRVGQSAIATARRSFDEASAILDIAADEARGHELAQASVAWRRAELELFRERYADAFEALAEAIHGFRRTGSLRGLHLCARLEGDLAAVSGDRLAAVTAWAHATSLCIRTRNLHGIQRLLTRRLAVEREGSTGPHVDEIEASLRVVDRLLSPG